MLHSLLMIEDRAEDNLVVNLDNFNQEQMPKKLIILNLIQDTMRIHLPTKQIRGKEPLVNYSQSHVVTSAEYLVIMCKNVMEKLVAKLIRETHHKEREENKVKKITNYFTIDDQASQCVIIRNAKEHFQYNWSTIIVREAWQCLSEHLQASWVCTRARNHSDYKIFRVYSNTMGRKVTCKGLIVCS